MLTLDSFVLLPLLLLLLLLLNRQLINLIGVHFRFDFRGGIETSMFIVTLTH